MSIRRRSVFIVASIMLWGMMGLILWGLLDTLEFGCKLQERQSGLWAECFAPAALIFTAAFALLFTIDSIRLFSVLMPTKPAKG
jgi:hypothetical protein